jgi:apolipoprotein N-acyltransferase
MWQYCSLIINYCFSGWRQTVSLILLGVIAATALPPWYFMPGIFAFAAFALQLGKCKRPINAAYTAWLFGFGFHLLGLHWIANAFLIDGEKFAFLIPFVVVGLPAILAIFPAITMAILPLISRSPGTNTIAIAFLWSASEYLRGHLFTGFPWNLTAYTVSFSENLVQAAAFIGAYGLSFLVLVAAVAPSILFMKRSYWTTFSTLTFLLSFLIPVILWFGGLMRLSSSDQAIDHSVLIRIVQANIPQRDKWKSELRFKHISKYLELSNSSTKLTELFTVSKKPDIIVWPETAVPAFLSENNSLRIFLTSSLPKGSTLITGAPSLSTNQPKQLYNSLFVISKSGTIKGRYDKVHLVPFGEYIPLKNWLPFSKIVNGLADFRSGTGPNQIDVPFVGIVSPLICYEVIFPGSVIRNSSKTRPKLLINLTNDAWFGRSSGPFQHLAIAKMRAIEEGIPLLRAANTGVSGFYDAYGRNLGEIGLSDEGVLDRHLFKPTTSSTLYGKFGDNIYFCMMFLCIIVIFFRKKLRGSDLEISK